MARAQKLADEQRQKGVTETQVEIERLREQALADIDAERLRALADVRGQVADLALLAAGKVVGETMSDDRERRLVDEFLTQVSTTAPTGARAQLMRRRPPEARMPLTRSTARRYAEAAFEIAERDDTLEAWLSGPGRRRGAPRRAEAMHLLANPAIPAAARIELLGRILGDDVTGAPRNLLALLVTRGRIESLPAVRREFRACTTAARASSRPP